MMQKNYIRAYCCLTAAELVDPTGKQHHTLEFGTMKTFSLTCLLSKRKHLFYYLYILLLGECAHRHAAFGHGAGGARWLEHN